MQVAVQVSAERLGDVLKTRHFMSTQPSTQVRKYAFLCFTQVLGLPR